ncbi:MAG TPA: hypothetical protein VHL98_18750 [Microvirga sp.]|nr:hypothetical protein [Microvirga sp.]
MNRFSITFTAGAAALGIVLLAAAAAPAPANQAAPAKDQTRLAAIPAETGRPAGETASATRSVAFRFADCLAILADVAREESVTPVTLVSTPDLRVARIAAADGAVTITCDRSTSRMSLAKSAAPAAAAVMAAR